MSTVFIGLLVFLAAVCFIIYGKLEADCAKPAEYHFSVFKYDLDFTATTKPSDCLTSN